MFKPFKPPLLKNVTRAVDVDLTGDSSSSSSSPAKRRREEEEVIRESPPRKLIRVEHEVVKDNPPKRTVLGSDKANQPRRPLLVVNNGVTPNSASQKMSEGVEGYYMVLWRKFTAKKHKTWDGDGVLSVSGGYARLQDVSGQELGRCMFKDPLLPGSTLKIGGKDVEVDCIISKADFMAGKPFLGIKPKRTPSLESQTDLSPKPATKPAATKPLTTSLAGKPLGSKTVNGKRKSSDEGTEIPAKNFYASAQSTAMKSQFKNPLRTTTVVPQSKDGVPTPRHDPHARNALVMKRPSFCPKGKQIVDVVVDPFLTQHLREHQREGVKFLYECVMGMRSFNGQGAILADEMGLGKTLQTIALLWTLIKQNPIHSTDGVIKKALIVCPVSLVGNWKKEFNKWLGNERIGVLVADDKHTRIRDFTHGRSYKVMIIGYEKLRNVQEELKTGGIDIVIADEGHRLKTANNKSAQAIRNLDTERRVILSGTPIQNDLSEFFVMVNFVNSGVLSTIKSFKKEFEAPILKSRQPGASNKDIEKGKAREEELSTLTKQFILRRTAEILKKYLPPKTEYVLFCQPTQAQAQVYQHALASPFLGKALGNPDASFQLINLLKKVCNTPSLLKKPPKDDKPMNPNVAHLLNSIPADIMNKSNVVASSKFRVLDRLLTHLSTKTNEKLVLVSNYTSTLDLLQAHLVYRSLPFSRLDGKTLQSKRQDLVDTFNRTPSSTLFAFLLSAKSGGVGINLIGASRLVLFDVDWNPAIDLQAMARIHRDGQKKPVHIYRFLMSGGMDEKIYQRQITKVGLADSVVDGKKNEASFTAAELRDMFKLDITEGCQTHVLMGCDCEGAGILPDAPSIEQEVGPEKDCDEDEDSDDDLPLIPRMVAGTRDNVSAINAQIAEAEKRRKKGSKGKMQALMQYAHVDTSVFWDEGGRDEENEERERLTGVIDDDLLCDILGDQRCKVGWVFVKR